MDDNKSIRCVVYTVSHTTSIYIYIYIYYKRDDYLL